MPIDNRIVNSSFESGQFSPFVSLNASIVRNYSHLGYFSVLMPGGPVNSYVYQFAPVIPGETFELFVSLSRLGAAASPAVSFSVEYYDAAFNFIEYQLIDVVDDGRLPDITTDGWTEFYSTTGPAPANAAHVFVLVNKLPRAVSSDVLVDNISLIATTGTSGPTGAPGPTGACGIIARQTYHSLLTVDGVPRSFSSDKSLKSYGATLRLGFSTHETYPGHRYAVIKEH